MELGLSPLISRLETAPLMKNLTLFYWINYLALLGYLLYLSSILAGGPFRFYEILMILNTPLFLLLFIKWIVRGIGKLSRKSEFQLRYLIVSGIIFAFAWSSVEFKILLVYRDHINLMLAALLFEQGIMTDIGLSSKDYLQWVVQVAGLIVFEWATLRASASFYRHSRESRPPWLNKAVKTAFPYLIAATLSEKIAYSYLYYNDREPTIRMYSNIPSYTPYRMKKVWGKLISSKQEPDLASIAEEQGPWTGEADFLAAHNAIQNELGNITSGKTDMNILFLVFESLRGDMLDPEIMPNLYGYSKDWISAPYHFSNSNCTASGKFGLLSGLSPFFWYPSMEQKLTPAPLKVLKKLNYELSVYATSPLNYSDMDTYVFTNIFDREQDFMREGAGLHHPLVKRSALNERDEMMVEKFLQDVDEREDNLPHFDYLFFYTTHFNYYFPSEFAKFTPYIDRHYQIYEEGLHKEAHLVFNRYKNSAYYADFLIYQIVEHLRKSGRLEKTIIVVTGDHGEEFYEYGRFSHSYSFKNVQAATPFVIHLPGITGTEYTVSGHADIMPTIFEYLEVSFNPEKFTNGKSLINYDPQKNFALVQMCQIDERPRRFMIADGKLKLEFKAGSGGLTAAAVETINDVPLSLEISGADSLHILELLAKAKDNRSHFSN